MAALFVGESIGEPAFLCVGYLEIGDGMKDDPTNATSWLPSRLGFTKVFCGPAVGDQNIDQFTSKSSQNGVQLSFASGGELLSNEVAASILA
jgi:hypothetical protein